MTGPKNRQRPWWRRSCKRTVKPGEVYCWQHKGEHQ